MGAFRVDTVFPFFTGDASDVIVNTMHFVNETLDTEQFGQSVPVFMDPFWNTIYGPNSSDLSAYIDWDGMKYRTFNLDDPTPRVPYEENASYGGAGLNLTTIPTEVACVASFQSQGVPGEVYQRRYNRIYIGGLTPQMMSPASTSSFPIFNSTFTARVAQAMADLDAALPGPSTRWVQVSKATGTPRYLPVIGGWVDNSPDTQRRRSVDASLRTTWSA